METNNEKNMFGLDEYTYNLLIDFFRLKPSIKIVRIFGSRVLGTSRKSSDIDLLMEGTFPDFMAETFSEEINNLKSPYRIDLKSIDTENILDKNFNPRNWAISEYFYKAKDFYPLDKYEEHGCKKPFVDAVSRWKYRFNTNFKRRFEEFFPLIEEYEVKLAQNIEDVDFLLTFYMNFKGLFEGLWKTLKDWYKENNEKILFPRKLLLRACEDNILSDFAVWNSLIYDFNIMTDENVMVIHNEIFYRLKTKYMPAIMEFKEFFEKKI